MSTTNDEIDAAVCVILDVLKVAAAFYPQLVTAMPVLVWFVNYKASELKTGVANGTVVHMSDGSFVTKSWADDPRHALNPDGSFKF